MVCYEGVIFDVDGTLLDSMYIWENVAAEYLKSRGATPQPGLNDDLAALGGHEIPDYFRVEYGLRETANTIQRGINKLLEDYYFYNAPLKAGVLTVLGALNELGVKMCVATATDRRLIEPALLRCGILDFFGRIFTCGEESTSKRHPDIYLRAAEYLGTHIAETLVVEDALYAIKSAKGAGFPVAAVYDITAEDKQEEIKSICDHYYVSMVEMLNDL